MMGMLSFLRPRSRSRVLRIVALVVIAAQAVSVCLAPSAEAFASRSAPAHVEEGGTHLHHSHTPETCPACFALQITGEPPQHDPWQARLSSAFDTPRPIEPHVTPARRLAAKSPRAPPLVPLANG
jgi:cytochrome c5